MREIKHHVYPLRQYRVYQQAVDLGTIPGMANETTDHHDSLKRLLEAAVRATAGNSPARRITDFKGLQRAMDATNQGWNAWKNRGLSKDGALKAEELFGCSATWLMTGKSPGRWEAESLMAQETAAPYITTAKALPVTLRAISAAPAAVRAELADALALFARTGADAYAMRIGELLAADQRRGMPLSRVEPDGSSPRAEVDPRKLEDVLGGLFELTGQPRKQARAAGRKLTLEMTAPRPPSSEPSPPGQPVHQPSATPRPSETSE